jgi:extradiol dioxygenase family protein
MWLMSFMEEWNEEVRRWEDVLRTSNGEANGRCGSCQLRIYEGNYLAHNLENYVCASVVRIKKHHLNECHFGAGVVCGKWRELSDCLLGKSSIEWTRWPALARKWEFNGKKKGTQERSEIEWRYDVRECVSTVAVRKRNVMLRQARIR